VLVVLAACVTRERERVIVRVVQAPAPVCPASPAPEVAQAPLSCGQATLQRAALVAEGKGDRHPAVIAIDARLASCADKTPTKEECLAVREERAKRVAAGYGPSHPAIAALDAELGVCGSP